MSATETAGRTSNGQFAAGNRGGPGNPHNRRVAELRKVLLGCLADDDLREVTSKLIELAKEGDLAAIKLLLAYTLGKPGPMPEDAPEELAVPVPQPAPASPAPKSAPATTERPAATSRPADANPDLMKRIAQALGNPAQPGRLVGTPPPKANGV